MELETKTFKNPSIWSYFHEVAVAAKEPGDDRSYGFSVDCWDMEVTFTRKPPPFEPGYYRRTDRFNSHPAAVWLTVNPASNLDAFRKAWKRVTVSDSES